MSALDEHADAYGPTFPYLRENLGMQAVYIELLEAAIRSRRVSRVLSLGIGHSTVISALCRSLPNPVKNYVIVEGSRKLVADLHARLCGDHKPTVVESYFEEFETSERFDLIEMGFVLEHVAAPDLVLRKMASHLSSQGALAIAVPNARSLHRLIGFHAGLLKDLMMLSERDRELGHRRYFDRVALEELLAGSGLRIEKTKGLMLKPLTTAQLAAAGLGERVMEALYRVALDLPDIANALYVEAVPAR
ncbi:MAG: methyltransferase domain-containing protein [Hyphomicrobiales bacterium]|nr:methyltransferase domain-containing protein [Hyphomicrobiales bacterium]